MKVMKHLLAGAAAGMAGGLAMRLLTWAGQQIGMVDTPLPEQVEQELEARLGVADKTGPKQEKALAMGQHMAMSALMGAGYGLLRSVRRDPVLPAGATFGLMAYGVNLVGLGPALGLTSGPWNKKPAVIGRRAATHEVFGLVTAAVYERVYKALA